MSSLWLLCFHLCLFHFCFHFDVSLSFPLLTSPPVTLSRHPFFLKPTSPFCTFFSTLLISQFPFLLSFHQPLMATNVGSPKNSRQHFHPFCNRAAMNVVNTASAQWELIACRCFHLTWRAFMIPLSQPAFSKRSINNFVHWNDSCFNFHLVPCCINTAPYAAWLWRYHMTTPLFILFHLMPPIAFCLFVVQVLAPRVEATSSNNKLICTAHAFLWNKIQLV